jgi:histidine kinase
MMNAIRKRFRFKLFASYLVVILVLMLALWAVISLTAPAAFSRHLGVMEQMMSDSGGTMMGQGQGPGAGRGLGQAATFYENFRASLNEAFLLAGGAAVLLALIASAIFSQQVVRPLQAISDASLRIAEGHYEERVRENWDDEFGRLAHSFNQMAEKLEQVEARRLQLIGDVSHELRTPLTAIKGSMEGLIDGVLPSTSETFEQIHHEADRLNRLVDDLQELSRAEAGAVEINLGKVDLTDLTRTSVLMMERQFAAKDVSLTTSLPANLKPVLADEGRMLQVLINLLGNALRYTPPGGRVVVSAELHPKDVWVSVRDSGIGIPVEHLPHVFDRFYRVDKSRSRQSGGGSGIGLTIARHLVEAQGGRIWVDSEGEGKGSVFTFTLPLAG